MVANATRKDNMALNCCLLFVLAGLSSVSLAAAANDKRFRNIDLRMPNVRPIVVSIKLSIERWGYKSQQWH